jgi:hypothetical protein
MKIRNQEKWIAIASSPNVFLVKLNKLLQMIDNQMFFMVDYEVLFSI